MDEHGDIIIYQTEVLFQNTLKMFLKQANYYQKVMCKICTLLTLISRLIFIVLSNYLRWLPCEISARCTVPYMGNKHIKRVHKKGFCCQGRVKLARRWGCYISRH